MKTKRYAWHAIRGTYEHDSSSNNYSDYLFKIATENKWREFNPTTSNLGLTPENSFSVLSHIPNLSQSGTYVKTSMDTHNKKINKRSGTKIIPFFPELQLQVYKLKFEPWRQLQVFSYLRTQEIYSSQ